MKVINSKNFISGAAGFTIIEVLIALAVFSISFLGYYSLHLQSVSGNAAANRVTTAAVWGGDRMERLLALKYYDGSLVDKKGDGIDGIDSLGSSADYSLDSDDGLYNISYNVVQNYPIRNVKYIRVNVSKKSGPGATNYITFDFYKGITK